ncbi:SufS family cysteine desulfurase [Mycoplasmatota bacterium]|nr:SufS family cysteine desulfurase [Mycoplasmatota bacterium]
MYKKDFPVLNKGITYLDSGASSLKPSIVMEAMNDYYNNYGVNVHRGVYEISHIATEMYEAARERVAGFINADTEEVVFTRGASSSLNIVASSYGLANVNEGDEIILSELEHHSHLLPWQNVAKVKKAKLVYIPLTKEGRITVDNFKSVLSDKTKVVALTYVSNVMGYVSPLDEIINIAHQNEIVVSVDAAQAAPHKKIDVKKLDCDFLSFSAHKMCGPTGVGVLYGKKELLNSMDPIEFGGDMNDDVGLYDATFKDAPYKFETGTMPIAEVIGFKTAVEYLESIGMDEIQRHEKTLRDYAVEKMLKIDGVKVYNKDSETGILAFNIENVHPHDAASVFDKNGVCLRAGHHCAQPLVNWLGEVATLRASFYIYNTKEDVDKFIESVIEARDFFGQF